jgi:hypothetical protein
MHELGETVHLLGARLHANRREMWPLREETAVLEARLKELTAPDDSVNRPSRDGGGILTWLKHLLRLNPRS